MLREDFVFKWDYVVSIGDTDAQQVVHYLTYLRLAEQARSQYYHKVGFSFSTLNRSGFELKLVKSIGNFHGSAKLEDLLEIYSRVSRYKSSSFRNDFEIYKQGKEQPVFTGFVINVLVDKESERAIPLTSELIARFENYEGRKIQRVETLQELLS